jgi:hypothetical protein
VRNAFLSFEIIVIWDVEPRNLIGVSEELAASILRVEWRQQVSPKFWYHSTCSHIPEDSSLHTYCHKTYLFQLLEIHS